MYKNICIATDGSDIAQKAVDHGIALAKSQGAKVTVVTATPMWSASEMAGQARSQHAHPIEDYEERHKAWADKVLEPCKVKAERAGVACDLVHATDTEPDRAIVDTARNNGCDVIVMASHGRGPIGRLLLGSVATKVLTYTSIPVLVVR